MKFIKQNTFVGRSAHLVSCILYIAQAQIVGISSSTMPLQMMITWE